MSYVSNTQGILIIDLILGRVSESDFLLRFPAHRAEIPAVALRILRHGLDNSDADDVEYGLKLAYQFDAFVPGFRDVLKALATEEWHTCHEDVIFALDRFRDPTAASVLFRTAMLRLPYLEHDESFALGVKCTWALRHIGTEEAVERLRRLAEVQTSTVARSAISHLEWLSVHGEDEPVRERATSAIAALIHTGTTGI